jgi:RimJ/RimL family protein N-acetyltransferase
MPILETCYPDGLRIGRYDEVHREALCSVLAQPAVMNGYFGELCDPGLLPQYFVGSGYPEQSDRKRWVLSDQNHCLIGYMELNGQRLSYFLDARCWRNGIMSRALKSLLLHDLKTSGARIILATVYRTNYSSAQLLERIGFHFRGLAYVDGRHTRACLAILRYEFFTGSLAGCAT